MYAGLTIWTWLGLGVIPLALAAQARDSIHFSVRDDDPHAIRRWLATDPILLNAPDADGMTPLHLAVARYRRRAFDLLVSRGAEIDAETGPSRMRLVTTEGTAVFGEVRRKWTPLHLAALADRLDMAKVLIEKGASLDARNDLGESPLYLAAGEGHSALVRLLLGRGGDPNAICGRDSWTPLQSATFAGHFEIARLLLANDGRLDILSAAGLGLAADVKAFLDRDPNQLGANDRFRNVPLCWAAKHGRVRVVEFLLSRNSPIACKDHDGRTPLLVAASKGHADVVQRLLAAGASANAWDYRGATALHLAAAGGHYRTVKLLLHGRARVRSKDFGSRTPLQIARSNGHLQIVDLLSGREASVSSGR